MSKNRFNWIKIYLILADYVIPVPLTVLMYFLWLSKTGSSTFSLFIILLGLVYGYIVPALFGSYSKLWKFSWPYQIFRNILIQHGFIYASYFALILYLVFPDDLSITAMNALRVVVSNFALFAIITSHHEILAIRGGMIRNFNSQSAQGKSATEVVANFAFFGFGLLGAAYAFCSIYAYKIIVIEGNTAFSNLVFYFIIFLLIMAIAPIPYFIKERKQMKINRELFQKNKHSDSN